MPLSSSNSSTDHLDISRKFHDGNFPAILGEEISSILSFKKAYLRQLLDGFGSPLNILLPYTFRTNLRAMQASFNDASIDGRVIFAAKVNRSRCFFEICAAERVGIDVSSLQELEVALAAGVEGYLCSASGPFKSQEFILRAVRANALIAIDSPEELHSLLPAHPLGQTVRLMLRWSGLNKSSRFGMDLQQLAEAAAYLQIAGEGFKVEGIAFHLGGYSTTERANHLSEAITILEGIRGWAKEADMINIGGGLPINYLSEHDWRRFQNGEQAGVAYARGNTPNSVYPHWSPYVGATALSEILNTVSNGTSLKETIVAKDIRVLVEPGRALMDQAGFSLFEVNGVRHDIVEPVAVVEGMSLSMSETWFGGDIGFDPILIPNDRSHRDRHLVQCFIAGSSCYEEDVLTWRKVKFPNGIDRGDILVFPNSAGYLMDMIESEFHLRPVPSRLALDARDQEKIRWVIDARFRAEGGNE